MTSILLGSISTVADTSEVQREAFNEAFQVHGLGWRWEHDDYVTMLERSGGKDRIAAYADSVGETVDAEAVHETKSAIFQKSLAGSGLAPRPGVRETIQGAKSQGMKVALVTTTSPENVTALLEALRPALQPEDFDVVVDSTDVERPKPDGAAYAFALQRLGEDPGDCIAVEDNVGGVRAAAAAGLTCVAFPNANTAGHTLRRGRSSASTAWSSTSCSSSSRPETGQAPTTTAWRRET